MHRSLRAMWLYWGKPLISVLYSIFNISDDQITVGVYHITLLHRVNKVDDFLRSFLSLQAPVIQLLTGLMYGVSPISLPFIIMSLMRIPKLHPASNCSNTSQRLVRGRVASILIKPSPKLWVIREKRIFTLVACSHPKGLSFFYTFLFLCSQGTRSRWSCSLVGAGRCHLEVKGHAALVKCLPSII